MRVETFKCATGQGWGVLVNGMVDTDVPYQHNEREAYLEGRKAYPDEVVLCTDDAEHYSNQKG